MLIRAIKAGRISHAYLLTGPRGVGKTSVARILAHEINELPYSDDSTHLDIIEIDAASNNGVEDVRDLREKVQIAPVSAAKKVYIIDEVHMLSKAAFNALLKTLEEPPDHIVFILATTDADKLPATIISRTQRYSFRAIADADAVKHLRHIADEEKIIIDDAALALIAERGDGSFRDSISLLDQLSSLTDDQKGITTELIEATLGLVGSKVVETIISAVESHDVTKVAALLEQTTADGISPVTLTEQLTRAIRLAAPAKPHLLPLLDSLLDVSRSSQPGLKLLATLGSAALEHKPTKSIALATPVLEISATIAELSKQATKIKPVMPAIVVNDIVDTALESKDFSWEALIEHTRKNYVALFSVLSKCTYTLVGNDLTLYTNSAFYKKKLDDQKYSTHLYEALKNIGSYERIVHTVPTAQIPKDSQAAAVAVIMGGGEEVVV
jgi:DNA polymerase-3 subunit gamma/tau